MEHSQGTPLSPNQQDASKKALITSMCGPLMNKVKLILQNPKKNKQLAQNANLVNLINEIAEHILPQYCIQNYNNFQKLSTMHSLCFLLACKTQSVFTSGVIRTCIDQNWDMKGFKSVLVRILHESGFNQEDTKKIQDFFDKLIQSQNLQSQSCIKAISQFLRNKNRSTIDEDDLKNPIVSFQTSFQFVKAEIEKFRQQNMSHTCFTVLHPWAYDLDLVDFKYVLNKDQSVKVVECLKDSFDAQVFWLSYFKAQLSASADEFFGALKEVCIINHDTDFFEKNYNKYKNLMIKNNFVISLASHAHEICDIVSQITENAQKKTQYNVLNDQLKLKQESAISTEFLDESKARKILNLQQNDSDFKAINKYLPNSQLIQLSQEQANQQLDLKRHIFNVKPTKKQTQNLYLKFTNVDTEELKDLEIKFDGNMAQFKVGEGESNHYVITNDKKLWESQFMILNYNGQFYIRDLGIVHTSRIKVNPQTQLQIQQGSLLDLGKVVHYHVDKLLHEQEPIKDSNPNFIVMRGTSSKYKIDDEALLRARPTWISADENKDLVQNEIILESTEQKSVFSVGRSNRRDVEIKLKAVSADHCKIEYSKELGWFIHEREKDKLSSNGTFVFMKSLQQMEDHEPSDFIPLFNGMTVSFINYELQVRIEPKNSDELANAQFEEVNFNDNLKKSQTNRSHYSQKQDISHQQDSVHVEDSPHKKSQMSLHSHKDNQHSDPYEENLQVTHQKQGRLQFIEEDQTGQNDHKHHNQQDEEFKSPPIQMQVHSQPLAPHQSVSQDHFDEKQSEHHHSIQKDPSQKSIRESVHSIKDLTPNDNAQDKQSEFQEVYEEDNANQESARSLKQQSVKSSVQASQHKDEFKERNIHQHDDGQQEHSPKSKGPKSHQNQQDEEERHHEMMRSYSQHHISEVLDKASQHHMSQQQLIHSDDEDEQKENNDKHHYQNHQDQNDYEERQSVQRQDEDVKSQKSLHSKPSARHSQQVQDDEHQEKVHDNVSDHHLHKHNQSKVSLRSIHQDHNDDEKEEEKEHSVHNQSVHHQKESSKQLASQRSHYEQVQNQSSRSLHQSAHQESQKSLHNQSVHSPSQHDQSKHNDDQEQHHDTLKQNSIKHDVEKEVEKSINHSHEGEDSKSLHEQSVHKSVHNQSAHSLHYDEDAKSTHQKDDHDKDHHQIQHDKSHHSIQHDDHQHDNDQNQDVEAGNDGGDQ